MMDRSSAPAGKSHRWKTALAIVLALAALCALFPYLMAARYALFSADDFSFAVTLRNAPGASHFIKSLTGVYEKWMGWQGTYSSTFLLLFLNPLRTYSYGMLRALLIMLLSGTAAAALLFSILLCEYLGTEKINGVLIWSMISIPLLSFRDYFEIYLWFTGAVAYLLPLLLSFLTLAFLLLGRRSRRTFWYYLSGFSAFMMSGGVLEVVGFGMYLLLALCILERVKSGRFSRAFCIIFAVGLAGALLNAMAPGNYARADFFSDPAVPALSRAIRALAVSVKCVGQEWGWLCGETAFPAILLLAFALGAGIEQRISLAAAGMALPALFLLPVVTAFPVVLGYNGMGISAFNNRTSFPLDLAVLSCGAGMALILGCLVCRRQVKKHRLYSAAAILSLAAFVLLSVTGGRGCVPLEIGGNLSRGSIRQYSVEWREVYDYLNDCGYEDVAIQRPMPEYCTGCAQARMAAYPEHWINMDIADYFGLKSVCLNPPRDVPDGE